MIQSDLTHVTKAKKKAQLRIRDHLGPIVCNTREAWREAERILEDDLKLNKTLNGFHMILIVLSVIEG